MPADLWIWASSAAAAAAAAEAASAASAAAFVASAASKMSRWPPPPPRCRPPPAPRLPPLLLAAWPELTSVWLWLRRPPLLPLLTLAWLLTEQPWLPNACLAGTEAIGAGIRQGGNGVRPSKPGRKDVCTPPGRQGCCCNGGEFSCERRGGGLKTPACFLPRSEPPQVTCRSCSGRLEGAPSCFRGVPAAGDRRRGCGVLPGLEVRPPGVPALHVLGGQLFALGRPPPRLGGLPRGGVAAEAAPGESPPRPPLLLGLPEPALRAPALLLRWGGRLPDGGLPRSAPWRPADPGEPVEPSCGELLLLDALDGVPLAPAGWAGACLEATELCPAPMGRNSNGESCCQAPQDEVPTSKG